MSANQCQATTESGIRCPNAALSGGQFCFTHDPDKAAEREAARAKGGAARAAQLSAPVPKMATAGDVRDYLARVMRDAEAQLIAPRVATSLANLARVQLDAVAAAAEENKPASW